MATLGLIAPKLWLSSARAQSNPPAASRKIFVVIQFSGGNDAINTLVPYTDSNYFNLRPMLAFKDTELKDDRGRSMIISNEHGLHPGLSEIKDLYDAGRVAIVRGAGYPDPNLSHFLSMDIWHTADLSGLAGEGWLGKYANLALLGKPGFPAASFTGELPKTLSSKKVVVPNILNFDLYNFLTDGAYPGDYTNQLNAFNSLYTRSFNDSTFADAITGTGFDAVQGAGQVQAAVGSYNSTIAYPDNPLAYTLRMAAQIITTLPSANLLYVEMGGFDNHADQIAHTDGTPDKTSGDHALLLNWFSEAVKAFYDDIAEHGLADNLVMMQWSEFGRRPGENASFGTDHGTAGVMFIIGNGVKGGIYGEQPSLAEANLDDAGNPGFTVDFREVYATILDDWLDSDSRAVLGGQYPNLGFFG